MITIKHSFKGNFTLKPGTIFSGYAQGSVENTDGRIIVASEPDGKNALEGDVASMGSLADAINAARGIEAAKAAPVVGPAPTVVGVTVRGDVVIVGFNNGTEITLRKRPPVPQYDFIPA